MNDLIRTVLSTGRAGRDASSSDAELLTAYTRDGDHAAFSRLVERHGPMVYAVCRRLLPDPNDADDAFQAVFLVFLRRAGSLRGGRLAGWFYGVALRTAKEARKVSARRQRLDEKYRTTNPTPDAEPNDPVETDDLRAVLDRELARLAEPARAAIILCDMEGRTRKEAAAELGCPEGTLATRLARARELLASRLARLGITLGAVGLVAFLAQESRAAIPTTLKHDVLRFPLEVSVAPEVLALAGKVAVRTGWVRAGLLGTAIVTVAAVTATGVAWVAQPGGGDVSIAAPAPAPTPAPMAGAWQKGHEHDEMPKPPPGHNLVAFDGQTMAFIREADGAVQARPGKLLSDAVVSPDGKRFVATGFAEGNIPGQLFVGEVGMRTAGKWLEPPKSPVDGEFPRSIQPSWSADGKRVVFLLDPTCSCMVAPMKGLVMMVDPATKQFRTTAIWSESLFARPKFHPDGRRIAVLHEVAKAGARVEYDLVLHAGNDRDVLLRNERVLDYAFSPDGGRVAVSVAGKGLLLLDLESRKEAWLKIPVGGLDPQHDLGELLWRPDGRAIAFRPVFVRGTTFAGQGLSMTVSPRPLDNEDRVGIVQAGEQPAVSAFFKLDTRYRLSHWLPDTQPQQ